MRNLVDVERRSEKEGLRKWRILAYFWFFHFLYCSRHVQITTNEGSERVFLRKEVFFGVSMIKSKV